MNAGEMTRIVKEELAALPNFPGSAAEREQHAAELLAASLRLLGADIGNRRLGDLVRECLAAWKRLNAASHL